MVNVVRHDKRDKNWRQPKQLTGLVIIQKIYFRGGLFKKCRWKENIKNRQKRAASEKNGQLNPLTGRLPQKTDHGRRIKTRRENSAQTKQKQYARRVRIF